MRPIWVFASPAGDCCTVCKAGAVQMTKALALELARMGIRVDAIAPSSLRRGSTKSSFSRTPAPSSSSVFR
ncbi:SDR family oxidoreductase [Cupriavidus sp. P-10]|uniref:SDR family oxidoreductase n=1 Tax=unclassified Cupriavidus TaxID=2640874 RepID=UPI000E2E613D